MDASSYPYVVIFNDGAIYKIYGHPVIMSLRSTIFTIPTTRYVTLRIPLPSSTIPSFLIAWEYLNSPVGGRLPPEYKKLFRPSIEDHYDYIIIGSGASGALLANRLATQYRVLVLEAGPDYSKDEDIKSPTSVFSLSGKHETKYLYPQRAVAEGNIKTTMYTTGRLLGGGTSINGEQCILPSPGYWEAFRKIIGSSRIWDNPTTHFKAIEDSGIPGRGVGGPLKIREEHPSSPPAAATKLVKAIGGKISDYNQTLFGSFPRWQLFQYPDGSRCSADRAFLTPDGPNENRAFPTVLSSENRASPTVLPSTTALKIAFEGTRAVSVAGLRSGTPITLHARREIIVSGGIYSAELLQRSGIGPRDLLEKVGIEVIVDSPHVGRHSVNHLLVSLQLEGLPGDLISNDKAAIYAGGAMLPSTLSEDDPAMRGFELIGYSDGKTYTLLAEYNQPHSEGTVEIQSADPLQISSVRNKYFDDPLDLLAFRSCYRKYLLPIADSLGYKVLSPTRDVIADDAKLDAHIKATFIPSHHWTGTNSMGKVVSPEGYVEGTTCLRVVDASIAPLISDGNTGALAYTIAAVIANHMLNSYKLVTLPAGTVLLHQREELFPAGKLYPHFIYNWYSSTPFWGSGYATYRYTTTRSITNLIMWEIENVESLRQLFTQMWPGYISTPGEINDYSLAAFAVQILGLNGMVGFDRSGGVESLILGGSGENWMRLDSITAPPGTPVHPGYKSSTIPWGGGAPTSSMRGIVSYSPEQIVSIREWIRNHPL